MEVITPAWPAPRAVRAAFTLRRGGVSEPPFDTLNLGLHTGDSLHAVRENRRRVRETLELPAEPAWLNQVHGAEVVRLGMTATRDPEAQPPVADATVTSEPGRVCAIQVADCIPVLLTARDGSAVSAAHVGWRGLAAGVLEAAVGALGVETSTVIAWLGPGIGAPHFEVGDEVRAALLGTCQARPGAARATPGASAAFVRNAHGRWQCDLSALARIRLAALGVCEVYGGSWCTYADAARFFSYRRDGRCGRMAALIWIER